MIYVVRHGECTLNAEGRFRCKGWTSDLTDLGREQARKAGEWLADKNIDRVYYSPFDRTQQTADLICESLDLVPAVNHDLAELDCGDDLDEVTYDDGMDDFMAIFFRWLEGDFDARFPGGEDGHQVFERFSRALHRVNRDENTVLVTHGGVTRAAIPPLCVNNAALKKVRSLSNTGIAVLAPYDNGRFSCEAWDLKEHLD